MVHKSWKWISQQLHEAVKLELANMLDKGIIQEPWSQWHSPLVVVPKKDGTLRLCMDFWKLNTMAKFDAFLMPRLDKMLKKVCQAWFIVTFDMTKGC